MSQKIFDAEFMAISVPVFERMSGPMQFDVYLRRAVDTYTRLFPKGEPLDKRRIAAYRAEKGVAAFFVRNEDYRQYLYYVEKVADQLFAHPEKVSGEELTELVKEMADRTMIDIVGHTQVDEGTLAQAGMTVKGCMGVLTKEPKSLAKIFRLMNTHPYMIRHSLATSIYALLLGQLERLESDKTMLTLGLGAMLHDIGMVQLSFDPEAKVELDAKEWKEIKSHPEIGKRMLDAVKHVTPEVRAIVMQHHEQPNGRGYPNGLHGPEIYYLAKIVSIADSFAALVSVRPYRAEAFSPLKALETMQEDRGKFDEKLLSKFASMFVSVRE